MDTLLLAPRPAGEARATSNTRAVCEERATKPAGLRAAARRGAAPKGAYRLYCRSSTMHTGIACVAAPRICPPGARAKMHTLFPDGPLVQVFINTATYSAPVVLAINQTGKFYAQTCLTLARAQSLPRASGRHLPKRIAS